MLARRFTIVCLLTALFGMFFSILVAQTSRSAHSWEHGAVRACSYYDGGWACNYISRHL